MNNQTFTPAKTAATLIKTRLIGAITASAARLIDFVRRLDDWMVMIIAALPFFGGVGILAIISGAATSPTVPYPSYTFRAGITILTLCVIMVLLIVVCLWQDRQDS